MRSAPPGPSVPSLPALAGLVDQSTLEVAGHVLVHVEGPIGPDVALGFAPIGDIHPFDALAGFTAPERWSCIGVRAMGQAHHLDDRGLPPERTAVTLLLDRHGGQATVLRRGSDVTELEGPAVGTIPDLCRRILGLPTAPAPPSSAPLWTAAWLDRALRDLADPARWADGTRSWGRVAASHPAIASPTRADLDALADPAALVVLARAHAAAHPWSRLRHCTVPLELPRSPIPSAVAAWMDDGFFARWALGAYPSILTMVRDLRGRLGHRDGRRLVEVVGAVLD